MKKNENFTIIIIIVLMIFVAETISRTCRTKEIDSCLTNFYYEQQGIPTNERQLRKSCSTTRILYECLTNFLDRCASPPLQRTLRIILDSIVSKTFDVCKKPIGHNDRIMIFKHSQCLNENQKIINRCSSKSKELIFFILESDYRDRIPIACCNFAKIRQCSLNVTERLCRESTAIFLNNSISLNPLFNAICSGYDPQSTLCHRNLMPNDWVSNEDPKSPLYRLINAFL